MQYSPSLYFSTVTYVLMQITRSFILLFTQVILLFFFIVFKLCTLFSVGSLFLLLLNHKDFPTVGEIKSYLICDFAKPIYAETQEIADLNTFFRIQYWDAWKLWALVVDHFVCNFTIFSWDISLYVLFHVVQIQTKLWCNCKIM